MPDKIDHNKSSVIEAVKRNMTILNSIVLLIVFTLFFLNVKFLFKILEYIPSFSVVAMLTIMSGLVLISLFLSKIITTNAIKEIEAYDNKLNSVLTSLQKEIAERKNVESQLEHQVLYDQLTNLPNRTLFTKRLSRMITRPEKHKNYLFAVLFIDLDRFKVVNDSLGHIIGDQLLIAVARRLEACIRPVDTIARFGGDEFAIFLDDINEISDAIRVTDRVQKELSMPFNLNGREVFTTASIGVALSITDYNIVDDILRDADAAMYRAKAHGRARYEIFDTQMHADVLKLLQLEADLWRAVERMEFLVLYQPIVSVTSGKITAVEALLRWQHPQHGFIPPMDFIPIAEETGLISVIGEWVLRTACTQNKVWQDAGYQHLKMSVNFSSRQFRFQDVSELIKRVLQKTGLTAQSLNIEITESIAMETQGNKVLNELTAMGVQTSIDDFGTGYSSLGSLKRFPINAIKIDMSFIKDITIDFNVEEIVKAIIAMSHSLGMKVIAEGVETKEQLAILRSHECDEFQGYLCSPPVTDEEFVKLLEKRWCLGSGTQDKKLEKKITKKYITNY